MSSAVAESCSYGSDELYFGSTPVSLGVVPGKALHFDDDEWAVDYTEDTLVNVTLRRKDPLLATEKESAGGQCHRSVVLPCIAARELVYVGSDNDDDDDDDDDEGNVKDKQSTSTERGIATWPEGLRRPLLKVPPDNAKVKGMDPPGVLKSVMSGHRSALIKVVTTTTTTTQKSAAKNKCGSNNNEEGKGAASMEATSTWFRLKGCGNDNSGFVLTDVSRPPSQTSNESATTTTTQTPCQMRGCAFMSTSARELYMTTKITKLLKKISKTSRNQSKLTGTTTTSSSSTTSFSPPVACNIPLGLYKYDSTPHVPSLLLDNNDELQPTCIVMQTRGDRRLGSHVLAGIELLLPHLIDESILSLQDSNVNDDKMISNIDEKKKEGSCSELLCRLFPPGRPGCTNGNIEDVPTTAQLMYYHMIRTLHPEMAADMMMTMSPRTTDGGAGDESSSSTSKAVDLNSNTLAFLSVSQTNARRCGRGVDIILPEKAPDPQTFPRQWTNHGPVEMKHQWHDLWTGTCTELQNSLFNHSFGQMNAGGMSSHPRPTKKSVLAYLFSRLGYECGTFLGLLHKHRISWGTYQDGLCRRDLDEWHCNAHSNNMVLLPQNQEDDDDERKKVAMTHHHHDHDKVFLSFLDLDMAFDEGTYVDIFAKEQKREVVKGTKEMEECTMRHGAKRATKSEFDKLLLREKVNFMEVLAGGDSSTGVPQLAMSVVENGYSPVLHAVKTALYDTLILGFLRGYEEMMGVCHDELSLDGGETSLQHLPVHQYDPLLHQAAHTVAKLGVIVMAEYVA